MEEVAVQGRGLVKDFGRKRALDGLDVTILAGEVFGLLGNNGAGKTTTLHALLGLLQPTSGSATVLGVDPSRDRAALLRQVGFFAEGSAPYEWLTVAQLCRVGELSFPRWDRALCEEMRRKFELDPASRIGALSKGMAAKAKLLLAMAHRPKLVVLDEPTSGLDPGSRQELLRMLTAGATPASASRP